MCVGRGRSSTYGRSPRSVSAECVRSYIRQNLNDFSPPMAGYPFRLPVRASVQVTSWRGPHFPWQRLNQGCPGTHCLRFAEDSKRLGSCNQTMRLGSRRRCLYPTRVWRLRTCCGSRPKTHVGFIARGRGPHHRPRTAGVAFGVRLEMNVGPHCARPRTSRSAEDPSIEDRRTLMERGAHPLTPFRRVGLPQHGLRTPFRDQTHC